MKYEKNQNFENCFFKYKSIIGNNCVFIDTRKILFLFNFSMSAPTVFVMLKCKLLGQIFFESNTDKSLDFLYMIL